MVANPKVILESIVEQITNSLLDIFGEEHVESVIISGSLAEDRIAFFDKGDSIEIYSDIDISVILSKCDELDEARERARELVTVIELSSDNFKLLRSLDIGVYDRRDLINQPARPGTVDMKRNCRVVYGHDNVFKKEVKFEPEEIHITEALYLLENRMIELAMAEEMLPNALTEGTHRFVYYLSLKLCLDVLSAFLVLERNYSPDPEERMRRLLSRSLTINAEFEDDLREAVQYAHERINHLQEAMLEGDYDSFRRKVKELSLLSWKRIAEACLFNDKQASWRELVKKRCSNKLVITNLRQAMVFSRRLHLGLANGLMSWLSGFRITPINALRLSGLIDILAALASDSSGVIEAEGLMKSYLDKYTRRLGFVEGPVFSRARRLYRRLA